MEDEGYDNWIAARGFTGLTNVELYIASYYFAIQTITTVGYGDATAYNLVERVASNIFKFAGVVGFSFASGTLASIITNMDAQVAKLKEKDAVLTQIKKDYDIPDSLFIEMRNVIKYATIKNNQEAIELAHTLPPKLQSLILLELNKDVFS
jgi:hypothetical protein